MSHAETDRRANDPATALRARAAELWPGLVAIRRDLHAHPKLGFAEFRTAGVVAAELTRLGIPDRAGVGGTGVLGTIEGGRAGPTSAPGRDDRLHHADYQPDERCIQHGVAALSRIALDRLA